MTRLLEPMSIGTLTIANRIVHGSISTKYVRDGVAKEEFAAYHAARARGGAGLIVTEALSVCPTTADPTRLAVYDERNRRPLESVARSVRESGSAILGQLWHNGNARHNGRSQQAVGISPRPDDLSLTVARIMSESDLDRMVERFVHSALVLANAGFAGVELSGAHGFLIHQTLSPHTNDRDDAYGGSRSARLHFVSAIIDGIRKACGKEFVTGLKLPADDGVPGSIDPGEAAQIVTQLRERAPPDYFCFSAGSHSRSLEMHLPATGEDELGFRRHLRVIAPSTGDIPVLAVGKITTVQDAERILREGDADAVVLARGLLADPDLPRKLREGRPSDIVPCIACNFCWGEINRGRTIGCAVNPDVLRSGSHAGAGRKGALRSVALSFDIVGSGVAAMEAGWRLAEGGHSVRLLTGGRELGGGAVLLSRLLRTGDMSRFLDLQHRRLERCGVEVNMDDVKPGEGGARIIDATGATMAAPGIGGEADIARSLRDVVRAHLADSSLGGEHGIIFDNDHTEGTYLAAAFLAGRYRRLTIVTPRPALAMDASLINAQKVHRCSQQKAYRIVPFHEPTLVEGGRLALRNVYTGDSIEIAGFDLLTYSTPRLQNGLGSDRPSTASIGDALAPRDLMAAIKDAHALALDHGAEPA